MMKRLKRIWGRQKSDEEEDEEGNPHIEGEEKEKEDYMSRISEEPTNYVDSTLNQRTEEVEDEVHQRLYPSLPSKGFSVRESRDENSWSTDEEGEGDEEDDDGSHGEPVYDNRTEERDQVYDNRVEEHIRYESEGEGQEHETRGMSRLPKLKNFMPKIFKRKEPRYYKDPAIEEFTMVPDLSFETKKVRETLYKAFLENEAVENYEVNDIMEWFHSKVSPSKTQLFGPYTKFLPKVFTGEKLDGLVLLKLRDGVAAAGLEVRLGGWAQVFRVTRDGRRKPLGTPHELLNLPSNVMTELPDGIEAGEYSLPFSLQLPGDLPPSCVFLAADKMLVSAYFLEARVVRRGSGASKDDISVVMEVPVSRPLDMSAPDLSVPAVWAFSRPVKRGILKNTVHVEVRLPRQAFLRTEVIPVTVLLHNQTSSVTLRGVAGRLVLRVSGKKKGGKRKTFMQYTSSDAHAEVKIPPKELKVAKFEIAPIFPEIGHASEGTTVRGPSTKPAIPHSGNICKAFAIEYFVEVLVGINGESILTVETPIMFGNFAARDVKPLTDIDMSKVVPKEQ